MITLNLYVIWKIKKSILKVRIIIAAEKDKKTLDRIIVEQDSIRILVDEKKLGFVGEEMCSEFCGIV